MIFIFFLLSLVFNIQKLTHNFYIRSILFFKDKNKLISSGYDGTRFWDSNNYNNINLIDFLYDEIMKLI